MFDQSWANEISRMIFRALLIIIGVSIGVGMLVGACIF